MILIKTNINNMANLDKFREETKEWLDKNCPPSMKVVQILRYQLMRFGVAEMQNIKILNLNYG